MLILQLVTEEKFCILFHTKLQVGQLQHDIWVSNGYVATI